MPGQRSRIVQSVKLSCVGLTLLVVAVATAPGADTASANERAEDNTRAGFTGYTNGWGGEQIGWLHLQHGVRVHLNVPAPKMGKKQELWLVFYALPNGNTIEQTAGKVTKAGDDWRFEIQHISAQTRFLREMLPDKTLAVAYLENNLKSWPAWRKQFGDGSIPRLLEAVEECLPRKAASTVLSGHSGGGSLIFAYLNSVERIPGRIGRIAFLDANYAYDTDRHEAKLARWLDDSHEHYLCVLAYDDASALLDGKPFVSASGGTWGRSHQMYQDLAGRFQFVCVTNAGVRNFSALRGRVQFLLKENPERKILHTVQVEKNGFIHSMVCGTPRENCGYEYFGERAYSRFIQLQ